VYEFLTYLLEAAAFSAVGYGAIHILLKRKA